MPMVGFWHPRCRCRESDPRLLAEILIIFPPSALALTKMCVVLDKFDCAYPQKERYAPDSSFVARLLQRGWRRGFRKLERESPPYSATDPQAFLKSICGTAANLAPHRL